MNFKRSYLAMAVAAALGSTSVYAAVDLDAETGMVTYGQETVVDDTNGTQFPYDKAGYLDITHKTGTVLSGGQTYYVRYDLTGAEWTGSPIMAASPACGSAVSSYHPNGNTSALVFSFEVNVAGDCTADTDLILKPADPAFKMNAKGPISVTYAVYEDQADANNQTANRHLAKLENKPYVDFAESYLTKSDVTVGDSLIDVAQSSQQFEKSADGSASVTETAVCAFKLDETTGVYMPEDELGGSVDAPFDPTTDDKIDVASNITDETQLVLSGNFNDTDSVYFAKDKGCVTAAGSFTVDANAGTATYDMGNNSSDNFAAATGEPLYVCLEADGSTAIQVTDPFELRYQPTGVSGAYSLSELEFKCASVTKGGSSASVAMVLKPGGAYTNFVRISNPSTVGGNVYVYAYDDAGVEYGAWTFNLDAGASTGLITPTNIATETGASIDGSAATIGTGNLSKLRLKVEAEFGRNDDGTGVQVRSYVLSKDANTFSYFQ